MNPRPLVFIIVLSLFLLSCNEQPKVFEGIIYYRHYLYSCSSDYSNGFLFMNFDTSSQYYYKNGNYRWINKNAFFKEDIYLEEENRNYFKAGDGDLYYGDGAEQDEIILSFSEKKNQDNVLGMNCNMLSLIAEKKKNKSIVYTNLLYSPEIKIDPTAFSGLKFLSHDFITSRIQSLPLRIEMFNSDFEIIFEATKVEYRRLEDSIFTIRGKENALPLNRLAN